jgi:hypothetical protein
MRVREIATQKLPEGYLLKEGYFKRDYIDKVLNAIPNPRLSLHYNVICNLLTFEKEKKILTWWHHI